MSEEYKGTDLGGFFAVSPKHDCPHIEGHVSSDLATFSEVTLESRCGICDNMGENWVCLSCGTVQCSRYVKEHMAAHAVDSQHAIALSFTDLSIWCYHCDSYIQSSESMPILSRFHELKFGPDLTELTEQIGNLDIAEPEEEERDPKLFYEKTVEELAEKLKSGVFSKIAVMAGAGISVSAGIPDFRTPGSGLYSRLEAYELEYPEQVFEISYFKSNPAPFFTLSSEIMGSHKPTPTHHFFKLLHDKGLLLMCYTQNIDGLEFDAGLPEEKLVQAHGHYRSAHCTDCGQEYPLQEMLEKISEGVPAFCACGHPAKPDVVFFGESLPSSFFAGRQLLKEAELLVIVGTSLAVYPFAGLASSVKESVPRVLINMMPVSLDFKFGLEEGNRDVFIQGECDKVLEGLVGLCGWQEEFEKLKGGN